MWHIQRYRAMVWALFGGCALAGGAATAMPPLAPEGGAIAAVVASPLQPPPADEPAADDDAMQGDAEREELLRRIRDLERQLNEARRRIADLERQLRDRAGGDENDGAATQSADDAAPPATMDADDPLRSPSVLLDLLKAQYAEITADLPRESERDQKNYLRALERWAGRVNREHRGRVDWIAEIDRQDRLDTGDYLLDVIVISPEDGQPLGQRFAIELPDRFESAFNRIPEGSLVRIKGVFKPDIRINPDREEAGTFDVPWFIGPFAEFGYTVQVQSIAAVEDLPPLPLPGEDGLGEEDAGDRERGRGGEGLQNNQPANDEDDDDRDDDGR